MAQPIVVDTDVMVDYLRGVAPAVAFVSRTADRIVLPTIVVAELYAVVKGEQEERVLGEMVGAFRVAPVTASIAMAGGLFRRDFGKSHGVGLADAIIAATASAENAALATLNVRHFPMIDDLTPAYARG